jgi:hypothetical protein
MTRSSILALAVALVCALFVSCGHLFEDNGTHLAFALERGVKELRASNATETVVRYEALDGPNQSYYVEITPSLSETNQATNIWGSYLVVSGKTSGGTSYHNRFVFVPKRLYIQKEKGATELVLRKDGDRVSVVEVR